MKDQIKSFAELKRRLQPGAVITLISRDTEPLFPGYDGTGVQRKVLIAQGNAIAMENPRPNDDRPSWLYWPKAAEVELLDSGFKVRGMTFEINEES